MISLVACGNEGYGYIELKWHFLVVRTLIPTPLVHDHRSRHGEVHCTCRRHTTYRVVNGDLFVALALQELAVDIHLSSGLQKFVLCCVRECKVHQLTAAVDIARHPRARAMAPLAPAWRAIDDSIVEMWSANFATQQKLSKRMFC